MRCKSQDLYGSTKDGDTETCVQRIDHCGNGVVEGRDWYFWEVGSFGSSRLSKNLLEGTEEQLGREM